MDIGGGKIRRKSIILIFLLALSIILCIGSVAAAADYKNTTVNNVTKYKAAGSATTTFSVSYSQLAASSKSVKTFVDKNKRLPNYVTIGSRQVTMPQYLNLLSNCVVNLNSKKTSSVSTKSGVNTPPKPVQSVKKGTLTKSNYVSVSKNVKTYISKNGRLPNYANTKLGKMRYELMVYTYSKVVDFYRTNKRLPNTVSVNPSSVKATTAVTTPTTPTTSVPANMAAYLKETKNAQQSNINIKNLAANLTAGKTTNRAKAEAIFNWVRDNLSYSFYYNTKKGAVGALSSKTGNCVDTSHLVVALSRAVNLPARYQHGECKFSDGWFGHVWAQIYVDGAWLYADAISDRNTLGTIKNWDLKTVKMKSYEYIELPF